MPKSQFMDPNDIRKKGELKLGTIKLNQYDKTVKDEKAAGNFTDADLLGIYSDMQYIREFETMLLALKTNGNYHGIPYSLKPSVALDLGREALSVNGEMKTAKSLGAKIEQGKWKFLLSEGKYIIK